MKKAAVTLMMALAIALTSFAQEVVVKKTDKVKKTTTIPQKVHNVFSKHKKYKGTKSKHVVTVEKAKS